MGRNRTRSWAIYRLEDGAGAIFYVGATRDVARRKREHAKVLGYAPTLVVVDSGEGSFNNAERKWIAHYRAQGCALTNKTNGGNGCWTHSAETRRSLSRHGKGRPKPPGFGALLSAITKGKKHHWTAEGDAASRPTRFKQGHPPSPKAIRASVVASRARWARIPPDERSRMATELNRSTWANRSRDARAAIGANIRAAQMLRPAAERKAAAGAGGRALWASLTPEERTARARHAWHSLTAEQQATTIQKRAETRRRNRELREAAR